MNLDAFAVDLDAEIGLSHAPEAEAGAVIKWLIRVAIAVIV